MADLLSAISYTPSSYVTPVSTVAADVAAAEIANTYSDSRNLAFEAVNQSIVAINWAYAFESSVVPFSPDWLGIEYGVAANTVTDPTVSITDYSTDVLNAFNYAFGLFETSVQPTLTSFLASFFPSISTSVVTDSDNWIDNTILNGNYVPTTVEDAMWNKQRDRETQDASRASSAAYESAANRGFSLPTGVTIAILQQTQTELAKKNASVGREIVIEDFKIANENSKFAIEEAVKLRTAFVQALADFIKIVNSQTNQAVDYARTILTAKTSMHEEAMKLFLGQVEREKMYIGAQIGQADADIRYKDYTFRGKVQQYESEYNIAKLKADTAMTAADVMFKISSSAFSTRNTMLSSTTSV